MRVKKSLPFVATEPHPGGVEIVSPSVVALLLREEKGNLRRQSI
jgi:hypothetical protein